MRGFLSIVIALLVADVGVARADSHGDMAAALAARAELHPAPAALPSPQALTRTAATPAAKRIPARADLGRRAADVEAAALARRAQDAAMSAFGQAQANEAKQRASHPHPH